jgi:hypothetical protein
MKIYCVRIGERYGPEYEEYLESKLPEYEFVWIREERQRNIKLQWNKMFAMEDDSDMPIIVMDIDVLLLNDYKKLFEFPIQRGQFLTIPGWWRQDYSEGRFTINGGFYKYYPQDAKYILEKFLENPEYWQRKYIEEGWTAGPINGEQHFIEDTVKERLELVSIPKSWVCRIDARNNKTLSYFNGEYKRATGNQYLFLGNRFHEDVKLAHFTNMQNLPHNWDKYELFV